MRQWARRDVPQVLCEAAWFLAAPMRVGRRFVDTKSHRAMVSKTQSKPLTKDTNHDGSRAVGTA
jgi:hypothetical protein